MLGLLEKLHHAALHGFALMVVMLACFLVGALCARLAIELDARALWSVIRRKAPEEPAKSAEEAQQEEA